VTGDDRLSVYGQLLRPERELLVAFREAKLVEDLVSLLRFDDNYVAVYGSGDHVWIVNSVYSLNNYFYAVADGRFLHGDSIDALAAEGPVDLSWNYQAIADLLALCHLVGDDTLARGVKPVPQGAILHWDGARLELRRFRRQDLEDPRPPGWLPDVLSDRFLDGLRAGMGRRPITTASSGLDSRLNLAGLLHLGVRPELYVMGDPASKDVVVVKQIGKAFNLPVNHVLLEPRDYLDGASEICRVTNGIKPLDHWHTYLLAKKSGYRADDRVVTGNNGEHVRAVGFDYGLLSHALDGLSRFDRHLVTGPLLARYWRLKTHVDLRPEELRRCAAEFAAYYGTKLQNDKFMGVMPSDQTFVWQNDAFVLEQRRRVFQSSGLKLMSLGFSPFSPFMRKGWVDAAWHLALSFRLGSRWHRDVIGRLCPALLAFPEEKEADRMLRRQRPLAWAPLVRDVYKRPKAVPYMDYDGLLRRRDVIGLLHDHASELEDFIPRPLVEQIVDEQSKTGKRGRLVAMLTGMALWRAALRGARSRRRTRLPESGPSPSVTRAA
jgi:hypothetical protein